MMRDLTKWPRLIVTPTRPEPVTRKQANEILLRTNNPVMCVNDKDWCRLVATVLVLPLSRWGDIEWTPYREWFASIGGLDLEYLCNSRIMSAWIGGPHGWCDWDGRIGCATYNIGKWPSRDQVTEEWQVIAAAFPFLDLHAQCIADEGDGEVAATWRVADGKAALVEPAGRVAPVRELTEGEVLYRMIGWYGERGVSLERLREAVEQVTGSGG